MSRASAITARALRVLLNFASPAIRVRELPGVLEAGELHAVQLHTGDFREHADEALLDDLEAAERLPELDALLAVGQSRVVRRHGVPERPTRTSRGSSPARVPRP
jgi:hypothetical protein